MEKTSPIIVSGSIAVDRIMSFSGRYQDVIRPEHLGHLSIAVLLDRLEESHGGIGANIAYTLALLGESPILLGAVGRDAMNYMKKLEKLGVITSAVHVSQVPTASFSVITDSEENQVGGFYPGAMSDATSLTMEPWKDQQPFMVVSPHDPTAMARQVEECTKWKVKLCYDVGQQVTSLSASDMQAGVEAADLLIVNEYEMATLAGKLGQTPEQIKASVNIVVTTFGKRGSVVEGASIDVPLQIGIVPATKVVDPTGAGDAYRAGFFYGFKRNWKHAVSAQLGATCAAFAIEQSGTQNHSFTLDEVAKRYEQTFSQPLPSLQTKL